MGSWATVWQIAAKRYETKRGEGTMSDHAFTVLQNFVMLEQQNAMKEALGGFYGIISSEGLRTGDQRSL